VPDRCPKRTLPAVLALAILLRLGLLAANVATRSELFRPSPEERAAVAVALADDSKPSMSPVGFEVGNVAYALVCTGEGFASPFGGSTGPTAWVAPGLVAVYAAAFGLFGCLSGGAVLALFGVALVGSVVTVLLAHDAATRLYPGVPGAPALAALLVALSPWDLRLFHAESLLDLDLPTVALLLLLALLLRLRERPSSWALLGFSVAAAGVTLVNPVLAAVAAVGLGFLVLSRRLPAVRAFGAFLLALLVLVGPYVAWQRARLGGWTFVKSNLPFELHLGNHPGGAGFYTPERLAGLHPSQDVAEYRDYRRLGELAYVRSRGRELLRELDLRRFALATVRRVAYLLFLHREMPWDGGWDLVVKRILALVPGTVLLVYPFVRRRFGGADLLVYLGVAAYLAPYALTGVTERYGVPVTAVALVLAAGAAAEVRGRKGGQAEPRTQNTGSSSGRQAGDSPTGP